MSNFRIKFLAVLFINQLICFAGIAQDTITSDLSFDQAFEMGLKQNHSIKQADYLKEQKKQDLKASRGINYPKIDLSANYVIMSEDLHLDLSPVRDAITPLYETLSNYGSFSGVPNPAGGILPDAISTNIVRRNLADGLTEIEAGEWDKLIQKNQFATVNLMASWPIFTGGKIKASKDAAKLGVEDADYVYLEKYNVYTSELVERYFGLCLARQSEQVRGEVLKVMESHLGDAEKMKNQGIIANAEYLHAKVYFSEAERELKKSQRQSKITNEALVNTLASDSVRDIKPISDLFYLEEIEPIEYFKEAASKNNPQLKQIESKKDLAHIGVKVENANFLPSVALMGTYDVWNKDLSPYVPQWVAGIGLKWTLFDGLSRERKRKSAVIKELQVEEFHQKANNDVETGIEKYYQEIQMSIEQINELNIAQEFTEEYLRVRQKAFHEGMATSTEVVDANLALVKVKIEKLQAAYYFDVSLAKLLELSGQSDKFQDYLKRPKAKSENFNK
jgi:outer membrane protein TolC